MNNKRIRFRARYVAMGCIAMLILAASLVALRPKQADLATSASRICSADTWAMDSNENEKWYSWLSEGQIVYVNDNGELLHQSISKTGSDGRATGSESTGIVFDPKYDEILGTQTSPDGRCILASHWITSDQDHSYRYCDSLVVSFLKDDRQKSIRIVGDPESLCFWGNNAFLELIRLPSEHQIAVYNIKTEITKRREFALPGGIYQRYDAKFGRSVPYDATLLGVGPNDVALIAWWDRSSMPEYVHSKTNRQIRFMTVDLKSAGPDMREYFIPVPGGAQVDDICLSQDGRKLAWQLHFNVSFPVSVLRRSTTQVWLSDLAGNEMHRLVTVEEGVLLENFTNHMLLGIHWMPDGKHISFIRRDYKPDSNQYSDNVYSISGY